MKDEPHRLTPEEMAVAPPEVLLDEIAAVLARSLARKHIREQAEAEKRKAS